MKTGIDLIKTEREEQILKHGRTTEMDIQENNNYQLSFAAKHLCSIRVYGWNDLRPIGWDEEIWKKMISKPYKERLIIAGALIAAELDRLTAIGKTELDKEN